jgi:propanol-preferring alcohol dehydrogenase
MLLRAPAPRIDDATPLSATDVPAPAAARGDVLVCVSVCGVCRTDLDLVEGRLTAPRYPVIPGHQVIGRVARVGEGVTDFREGDRVGVAWIHSACERCAWCRSGRENLCPWFRSTGCDENGGYADYVAVPAAFVHAVPAALSDATAAPLLCAGAIGWRSLRLTGITDGQPLGLTGFGASAHLVLQLARRRFPQSPVYVYARNARERDFARELGATWAGDTSDTPPERMAAIIDTTPAWKPVVSALGALLPGGRLVINAIRKSRADQNELLALDYAKHLWMEREIKSVANVTRADVREMLEVAVEMRLTASVEELPLGEANTALARLARGEGVRGALVLRVGGGQGS